MFTQRKAKMVSLVIIVLLVLGWFALPPATAGEATPPQAKAEVKEPNAAELYALAFEAISDDPAGFRKEFLITRFPELPEPLKPLTEKELAIIESGDVKQMSMPFVREVREVVETTRKASKINHCDWKLDWTQGPEMDLYHLEPAKTLSRLACMRADYMLDFSINTPMNPRNKASAARRAIQDLITTLEMARHVGSDGTVVSALVEISIENQVILKAASLYSRMDANAREILKKGILATPEGITLAQALECLEKEKAQLAEYVKKLTPAAKQEIEKSLQRSEQEIPEFFLRINELRRLLREGLEREVEEEKDGTPKAFTLTSEKSYKGKPIELIFDYPLPEEMEAEAE
ncbi:MAG: hypothetical protein JXA52_00885 [Planctomycetes bacterium]|nr:hypothetical protein [Planctomycetota bacterium]